MFDNLTERLGKTLRHIAGKGKLTEENIQKTLREVRKALLEADVALEVVKAFVASVKEKAIGQEVTKKLSPGQLFVKIVNDEMTHLMGDVNETLELKAQTPAVILMAGLQGSGKTTSVAKLAKHLQEMQKKSVMVVSCDVYRPAAIDQLQTVASQVGAHFFPSHAGEQPLEIAKAAHQEAKRQAHDVLIVDTAGRLHIDEAMMDEVKALNQQLSPAETLFVVDSMTGQDAARTAKSFHEALPLTGVILTKTDGDARGGAALSIRYLTGKPIKFLGVGEKLDALEPFYPDRVASRILGMGDLLSLIEEVERKVDKKKAEKLAKKITKGKGFDLEDLRQQLKEMQKMGGLTGMMDKLPGMGAVPQAVKDKANDKDMKRMIAVLDSMTDKEKRHPALIKGSRKKRIAQGSGTQLQDVSRVLKQHQQMSKMMKKFTGKGMANMMRGLQGRLPPGMNIPGLGSGEFPPK